jgi:PAS domain S-box-containing protein
MAAITGYTVAELLGRNPRMLQGPETDRAAVDDLRRAIERRRPVRITILNYRKDGTPYWCELSVSPVRGSSGQVTTFIGIIQDVTQRIEAEKEITRLNRDLEKASHQKDRFMAILSHELRTPMTPVIAASQILAASRDLPGDLMPLVDMVERNVGMEVRLIDDLLDITGIETGKLRLRPERVDLHDVLAGVLEMFQDVMMEKNLRLQLRPDAHLHFVDGDPSRLRQIFWNLIRNAVKFTPPDGTISIVTADEPDLGIRVDVIDTGRGIDPAEAGRLFEPFVQGAVVEVEFTGLGLGLAISKSLVELHGGTISVRSEGLGKGAVFTVRLKALPDLAQAPAAARAPSSAGGLETGSMRILLVDDHRDTRLVLELLLSNAGHVVHTAESVADAVDKAGGTDIDLVISDIGLPDGTGYDLLRRIRERKPVPAIALSGFGMEEDLQKSRRAGFAVHLTKPVTFNQIQSAIDEALR